MLMVSLNVCTRMWKELLMKKVCLLLLYKGYEWQEQERRWWSGPEVARPGHAAKWPVSYPP